MARSAKTEINKERIIAGSVRPSQLLWTYGPGATVDLPNASVMTMGIAQWQKEKCVSIELSRLIDSINRYGNFHIQSLYQPPISEAESIYKADCGIPVRLFPQWLRCTRCGMLSPYSNGLFDVKGGGSALRFIHNNCGGKGEALAVPARFLYACDHGHIDDFPWHWFVHGGISNCNGTLYFREGKQSLQTENLFVECDGCGAKRSMAQAFGKNAINNLPGCRGCHPHLNCYDPAPCTAETHTILLGATNAWFPVTMSALDIPEYKDDVENYVTKFWDSYFKEIQEIGELSYAIRLIRKVDGAEPPCDNEILFGAIQNYRSGNHKRKNQSDDVKIPEWHSMTAKEPQSNYPHFLCSIPNYKNFQYRNQIERIVKVDRLKEVNALLGFTRIESMNGIYDPQHCKQFARLSKSELDWLPAVEVHGEGIFIQFNEETVSHWESQQEVHKREEYLHRQYKKWLENHGHSTDRFPGIRYVMLHTFSHLLIRQISLECGYNSASLRERVYASEPSSLHPMAGILIYTAAADSDGTLGGLVDLAKQESMETIIRNALIQASVCSSDPICSEHLPEATALHAAACHACAFVSETSCELGNRFLDRALIVPTFHGETISIFDLEV